MDWSEVSVQELLENLRDVDWGRPRPAREFIDRFSAPKDVNKWMSRLKANVYYFRANYLLICAVSYVACFLRNPLALMAVKLMTMAVLCTNNSFVTTLNDQLLRVIRRIHPPTALKIRARTHTAPPLSSPTHQRRRGASSPKHYVLIIPRGIFVIACFLIALLLIRASAAWLTLAWGTLFGLGLPLLHATFRSPNLKAKLANAKHEFKAMWRGYQMEMTGNLGLGNGHVGDYPPGSTGAFPDYSR